MTYISPSIFEKEVAKLWRQVYLEKIKTMSDDSARAAAEWAVENFKIEFKVT